MCDGEIEGGMHYVDVRLLLWEPRAYEIYGITTHGDGDCKSSRGHLEKDQIRGVAANRCEME